MNRRTVSKKIRPTAEESSGRSASCLRHATSFLVALVFLPASPAIAFEGDDTIQTTVAQPISYDHETGRLAGAAEAGASIETTLIWIGDAAGFTVHLEPGLGAIEETLSFDGLTAEEAIVKLLHRLSFMVIHAERHGEKPIISSLWVLGSGDNFASNAPEMPLIEPESAIEEAEEVVRAIGVREIISLANKADAASVSELNEIALNADDPRLRRAAISALAGIAGTESHWLFRHHGLMDPDPAVRIEAARSLIRTDKIRGVVLVKTAALRETDAATRAILERLAAGKFVSPDSGISRTKLTK